MIHVGLRTWFAGMALLFGAAACSQRGESTPAAESRLEVPVGQLLSADDLTEVVRTRLFDPADVSGSDFDLARAGGAAVFSNRSQLGTFGPAGSGSEYQGGVPGPFNMMLWLNTFSAFGNAMATLCDAAGNNRATIASYATGDAGGTLMNKPRKVTLFVRVADQVRAVCTFQGDEAARSAAAGALFDSVMGRGGTLASDKAAFLRTFAADGSPFVAAPPKERVTSMFLAMMANPHFLLAK